MVACQSEMDRQDEQDDVKEKINQTLADAVSYAVEPQRQLLDKEQPQHSGFAGK